MRFRFAGLALVIGARAIVYTFTLFIISIFRLPLRCPGRTEGIRYVPLLHESMKYIKVFRNRLFTGFVNRLPECIEHQKNVIFLFKTNLGKSYLDRFVERIPDGVLDLWRRFGVRLMEMFLFVWGVILLVALGVILWIAGNLLIEGIQWLVSVDWLSLSLPEPPKKGQPEFNLVSLIKGIAEIVPQIFMGLAYFVVYGVIFTVFMWIIMLPFLPGLAIHEFGHYVSIKKSEASVEDYGLVLIGPLLAGAFVEPGNDAEHLDKNSSYWVWSSGISNSVLWGSFLIAMGIMIHTDPLSLFLDFSMGEIDVIMDHPLPSALIAVGLFESANAFLNAMPIGPVDGGGYIRRVEREYWGFHDAIKKTRISGELEGGVEASKVG